MTWERFLDALPLVAILRGVKPDEAGAIAAALHDAGIVCLEIPLNSPRPLESIATIRERFDGRMLIGAGTVLSIDDVEDIRAAGAEFMVSPNTNPAVIGAAKACGLRAMPGCFTATEAFTAIAAGADALKLFPADHGGPGYAKALKVVLPAFPPLFAVGGVDESAFAPYLAAGAAGFGLGSALYRPGATADDVRSRAATMVRAFREARS